LKEIIFSSLKEASLKVLQIN